MKPMTEEDIAAAEEMDRKEEALKNIFPVRLMAEAYEIACKAATEMTSYEATIALLVEKVFTPERVEAGNKICGKQTKGEELAKSFLRGFTIVSLDGLIKSPIPQDAPQPTHPGNGTYLI